MFAMVTAVLMPAMAVAQKDGGLKLDKGTMQLGGVAGVEVRSWIVEGEEEYTSALLELAPQFGYFVADHFELLGRLRYAHQLAEEEWFAEYGDSALGFDFGVQYFAGDGPCFYFGAQLGMELWELSDDPYKWFTVTVPMGALIPLNPHLAVDLGSRFTARISLEDEEVALLDVPMGFLGLQGFF